MWRGCVVHIGSPLPIPPLRRFFLLIIRIKRYIISAIKLGIILKGEKMNINRKQKFSLLCGAVAIVLGALNALFDFYHPGFDIYLVTVALITVGSFYALRDKKDSYTQNKRDIDKQ